MSFYYFQRISQGDLTQAGSTDLPNGAGSSSETAALCKRRPQETVVASGNNTHHSDGGVTQSNGHHHPGTYQNNKPTSYAGVRHDRPHCRYFPPILRSEIIRAQQAAAAIANNRTPSPSTSPSVVSTDESSKPLTKQMVLPQQIP